MRNAIDEGLLRVLKLLASEKQVVMLSREHVIPT